MRRDTQTRGGGIAPNSLWPVWPTTQKISVSSAGLPKRAASMLALKDSRPFAANHVAAWYASKPFSIHAFALRPLNSLLDRRNSFADPDLPPTTTFWQTARLKSSSTRRYLLLRDFAVTERAASGSVV